MWSLVGFAPSDVLGALELVWQTSDAAMLELAKRQWANPRRSGNAESTRQVQLPSGEVRDIEGSEIRQVFADHSGHLSSSENRYDSYHSVYILDDVGHRFRRLLGFGLLVLAGVWLLRLPKRTALMAD